MARGNGQNTPFPRAFLQTAAWRRLLYKFFGLSRAASAEIIIAFLSLTQHNPRKRVINSLPPFLGSQLNLNAVPDDFHLTAS